MTASPAEVWKVAAVVEEYLARRSDIPLVREQIELMLDLLATREGSIGLFLDLGCGDGVLGAAILGRFPESRGVLQDFSPPMLQEARALLGPAGARVEFLLTDYAQPAWADSLRDGPPFDAVVSGYSIHHQPDARKRALYAEILGLLGPGGWFVNVEHVAPAAGITRELFDRHFIARECAAEQRRGGPRTRAQIADAFARRPDKAANLLAPVGDQCDWLRESGFVEVDCYFKWHELAIFGGRRPLAA